MLWLKSLLQKIISLFKSAPKIEEIELKESKPAQSIEPLLYPESKPSAPPWLVIAQGEVGQTEKPGAGNNPKIIEYHRATTLKATQDLVPWCSAFVCWCLEKSGKPSPKSAWARSFLQYGSKLDQPKLGCIVVFSRNESSGHVGFFISQSSTHILVLGGNQDDQVKYKYYPKSRLLGYRWPV